jgi:hypothetical protein
VLVRIAAWLSYNSFNFRKRALKCRKHGWNRIALMLSYPHCECRATVISSLIGAGGSIGPRRASCSRIYLSASKRWLRASCQAVSSRLWARSPHRLLRR